MALSNLRGFSQAALDGADARQFEALSRRARADALKMITRAGSGHPGGALSSMDMLLMALLVRTENDSVVVSHGHISAGLYAALGQLRHFPMQEALEGYRQPGSPFEGHPSRRVPGVEWTSGALGQGLSVGCGMALGRRLRGEPGRVYVLMGDGEQQKGQIAEARAFAVKFGLDVVALVDANRLQASGPLDGVMPTPILPLYKAAGFRVIELNGHDPRALYEALRTPGPVALLCETRMGHGVGEIENDYRYHGKPLTEAQLARALQALQTDIIPDVPIPPALPQRAPAPLHAGEPVRYEAGRHAEVRKAAGAALVDVIRRNPGAPAAVLDCDLAEAVRVAELAEDPNRLIECGVAEANAASLAGGLWAAGVHAFCAGFANFLLGEAVSQHRMNSLNGAGVKLLLTHNGLDVGEDGKTHQCVDAISLAAALWNTKLLIPADANHADRMVRWMAAEPGPVALLTGRSALPVIGEMEPAFDKPYAYGRSDWLRAGRDLTIAAAGPMVAKALEAAKLLAEKGVEAGVLCVSSPFDPGPELLETAERVIVLEDHRSLLGLGALIAKRLAGAGKRFTLKELGVESPGASGPPEALYGMQGLSANAVCQRICQWMDKS
jgi:transketolase